MRRPSNGWGTIPVSLVVTRQWWDELTHELSHLRERSRIQIDQSTAISMSRNSSRERRGLDVRPVINPPIGQALAGRSFDRHCRAGGVVDSKLGAGILAEIEFGQIAV